MILTGGKRSAGTETCHSATLSTTNLTWTDLESNTRLRGDRPVTDSYHRVTEPHSCHHELVTQLQRHRAVRGNVSLLLPDLCVSVCVDLGDYTVHGGA